IAFLDVAYLCTGLFAPTRRRRCRPNGVLCIHSATPTIASVRLLPIDGVSLGRRPPSLLTVFDDCLESPSYPRVPHRAMGLEASANHLRNHFETKRYRNGQHFLYFVDRVHRDVIWRAVAEVERATSPAPPRQAEPGTLRNRALASIRPRRPLVARSRLRLPRPPTPRHSPRPRPPASAVASPRSRAPAATGRPRAPAPARPRPRSGR